MENKVLRCNDCYTQFIFSVHQQQKFAGNGWADPIRCPRCREKRKESYIKHAEYASLMQSATARVFSRHGRGFFKKMGR